MRAIRTRPGRAAGASSFLTLAALAAALAFAAAPARAQSSSINNHPVVKDAQNKILTWMTPASHAYDTFLRKRWDFIKTSVPMSPGPAPRSSYPVYYFYNGYRTISSPLENDLWMNDVGEKIPNWFESARLYYAYTGDASVMTIALALVDYALAHGTSPSTFAWPNFPYTTTNAGDIEFRGFTSAGLFELHEVQVDHAGDMGLTYYRAWLFTGDNKYLTAALNVANVLASKVRTGSATQSPWPYRVVMSDGRIKAEYGANFIGAYELLDTLVKAGLGNVAAYAAARDKARAFILDYPMKTGYWTDGHTDTPVNSNTYRANMSKSNTALYMLDNPGFDPDWSTHIPQLIQWTETYFVNRTVGSEPATDWGANIVGEQDGFLYKMDYQTARYAAESAKWYAASGDLVAKDKAFRAMNWVTYTSDANGRATESPYSLNIATWWSDCYGEGPRMVYQVFGAIPEWAPPGQDHVLYSRGVLKSVSYATGRVGYTPTDSDGVENLRLTFAPQSVTVGGTAIAQRSNLLAEGYTVRDLGGGDWAVNVRRQRAGAVVVSSTGGPAPTARPVTWDRATVVGVAAAAGSLSKTAATAWGNGGAASLDRIESGDGYVELTASETSTFRMIGLGNGNAASHYADIEYALYLAGPNLTVYEGGVGRPVSVPYAPGDVLRVAVVSGVVKYSRNGTVFYTSTVPPRYPLLVDTALFDQGATLGSVGTVGAAGPVRRRQLATSLVDWSPDSAVGVSVDGSSVTRTARSGTAGAASVQVIDAGEGYVELTASERASSQMIGLSRGGTAGWRGIDFALLLRRDRRDRDGAVHVYESGSRRRVAVPWREGDVLRVGIVDGTVEYSRNGVVFYRSHRAPAYPLRVETALFREGDTLSDVTVARAAQQ